MVRHADSYADDTQYANQDRVSTVTPVNAAAVDDALEICDLGLNAGNCDVRTEISILMPLLVAMRQDNRMPAEAYPGDLGADEIFDAAMCDVAERALETVGLADSQIMRYKLKSLLIMEARGLDHFVDLADHIARYTPAERSQIGLPTAYEKSTYRKAAKQLKEEDDYERLQDAACIAVHELFLNGVPIPDAVLDTYDLSEESGSAARTYSEEARKTGLYALVDRLLDIVVTHLDLKRGANASNDLRSLIGVFALSALADVSVDAYDDVGCHLFDLESAFAGSTIRSHIDGSHNNSDIDKLGVTEIDQMFNELNLALFEFAVEAGVVSGPVTVSFDRVDHDALGLSDVGEAYRTEDDRVRFGSLACTDPEIEFVTGFRLIKSRETRANAIRYCLRKLTSCVDVGLFIADREFDGVADIEACRLFVGEDWLFFAQDDSDANPQGDYATLKTKVRAGERPVVETAGYDDLHPPTQLIGHVVSHDTDEPDLKRAFYTDISLPDDDDELRKKIKDLRFTYDQRSKIEPAFRMTKNPLEIGSDTDKPPRKAFYVQMSMLFYNLYQLVNLVPAPVNGLEFDVSQTELLTVVAARAFHGVERPAAQDFLHEFP